MEQTRTYEAAVHPVVTKLDNFASFSDDEIRALTALFEQTSSVPAQADVVREDDDPMMVYFLIKGFGMRHKATLDGKRQILSFMMPGDGCDPGVSLLSRRDHSLTALVPSVFARTSDSALNDVFSLYPKVRDAFRWAALVEEGISREWILNVGQRDAIGRVAHLLCELHRRADSIGKVEGTSYQFPVTQDELADAVGLSTAHLNRTLQELRKQSLISFGDKRVTILDLARLAEVGGFDEMYLHLPANRSERESMGRQK